jgi:hypothetical protein
MASNRGPNSFPISRGYLVTIQKDRSEWMPVRYSPANWGERRVYSSSVQE